MEADILEDNLKWTSLLGITINSLKESVFMPNKGMELYYENEVYNASKSVKNYLRTIYNDNYLSYEKEIDSKHLVTASAGFRVHTNTFEADWGVAKNSHESDQYKQLQNGVSFLSEMGGESAIWNRLGVYAGAGYSYRDRYFLKGNVVSEFSSRTGKNAEGVLYIGGRPFGLFYSFGAAWRLSSESFLSDLFWLEDLKIRASYGRVGNDDIGNLSAVNYYLVDHYRGTTGMIPGPLSEQSVKFEENIQLNAGLDLSVFGNRLFLAVDLYDITTEDLLVYEPQEAYTGSATVPANNGTMNNRGWEAGLSSRMIQRGRFRWDLALNLSGFKNQLEAIKNGEVITYFEGGQYISRVGEPVLSFYGFQFEGVYATSEDAAEDGLINGKGVPFGAGDAKFTDLSGPDGEPDQVIDEFDRTIIGSPIPDFIGGLSSTVAYGRWSLSARLQLVLGKEVFNYLRYQNERMTDLSNQSTSVLDRWVYEGQVTEVPRALYDDPLGNADFSSRWIDDGSFLRLKHLTLAYRLGESLWFFRDLEVQISATNLFTWSNYLGYDPEFSFSYNTMEQGIDYGMMPQTQTFSLGLRIGL
jgi:TonB-linked SusC/RagA family outer membrane protein